jgi:hypothetical protein
MRAISLAPPARFLLRGSVLLAAFLTLWWLVLINPLQSLLLTAAEAGGALLFSGRSKLTITEAANGDWTFDVPIEPIMPPTPPGAVPQQIYSIGFDLARSDAGGFTFGLPVFWALILAAPDLRHSWRSLLVGTLAMAVLEVALLLITVKILAYKSSAQILRSHDPVEGWLLRYGEYLAVNAIPYLLPFAVAITLHHELRGRILRWAAPVAASAPRSPNGNRAAKRGNGSRIAVKRKLANSRRV